MTMNNLTLTQTIVVTLAVTATSSAFADSRVGGYTTKRGAYVEPHYKSSPNKATIDNYSSKGNFNPYTGKSGTKDQFKAPSTSKMPRLR